MGGSLSCRRAKQTSRSPCKMLSSLLLFVALAFGSALAQDDCPFYPGTCPITVDNVVEVSYYDTLDDFSCQADCQTNPLCKYFTMFNDDFSAHKKCFHFKECLEPCADSVTGPESPNIDFCVTKTDKQVFEIPVENFSAEAKKEMGYVCDMTLGNIIDLYMFDDQDVLVPERVHEPGDVLVLHVLHPRRRPQVLRFQIVRQPRGLRALRHGPTVMLRFLALYLTVCEGNKKLI